jgi:hypothetical protein
MASPRRLSTQSLSAYLVENRGTRTFLANRPPRAFDVKTAELPNTVQSNQQLATGQRHAKSHLVSA